MMERARWNPVALTHSFARMAVTAKVRDKQPKQVERDGLVSRREEFQGGLRFVFCIYTENGPGLISILENLGD